MTAEMVSSPSSMVATWRCWRSGWAATCWRSSSGMKRTPTLPLSIGPTMNGDLLSSNRVSTT